MPESAPVGPGPAGRDSGLRAREISIAANCKQTQRISKNANNLSRLSSINSANANSGFAHVATVIPR